MWQQYYYIIFSMSYHLGESMVIINVSCIGV